MARRVHAVVDGKVAADEVGTHSGALPGQRLIAADTVCSVLTIVDAYSACVSAVAYIGIVDWFGPVAATTEACGLDLVSLVMGGWDWLGCVG